MKERKGFGRRTRVDDGPQCATDLWTGPTCDSQLIKVYPDLEKTKCN